MTQEPFMFQLTRAPCTLTEMHQKCAARGDELENVLTLVVRLTSVGMQAAERLLPGIQTMANAIAGEEGHRGVRLASSTEMPHQCVRLYPRKPYDSAPVAEWPAAQVSRPPTFKLDGQGEGHMHLKLLVKATKAQMSSLTEWLKADMAVSLVPSQVTLQDELARKARENQEPAPEQGGLFGDDDDEAPDEDDDAIEPEPVEPFDPEGGVSAAMQRLRRKMTAAGATMTVSSGHREVTVGPLEPAEVVHEERPRRRRTDRVVT